MPRKSTAALSVAKPTDLGRVPEPPAELTDYQAGVWASVVATKPSDWFQADSIPLLVSYCKVVSQAAVLDQRIDDFEPDRLVLKEGFAEYKDLTELRLKVTGKIESLARSMRLTQQSRYDARVAANQSDKKKGRGWEAAK